MEIFSLRFLYLFLPITILIYYFLPRRSCQWKNAFLLLVSLAFYGLSAPGFLPVLCLLAVTDYLLGRGLERLSVLPQQSAAAELRQKRLRKLLLGAGLVKNLGLLLVLEILDQLGTLRGKAIPLGLLVYVFTACGYLIDVYKRDVSSEKNLLDYALFGLLFCKCYNGPLVRYDQMREQLKGRRASLSGISTGIVLLIWGLAKYGILARNLQSIYLQAKSIGAEEPSMLGSWMIVVTLALTVFFRLSGYCDMARGLGHIFGFELPKNFYYPYQSQGMSDFSYRFNMTVSRFFRHYVYDALGTSDRRVLPLILNTSLVSMLMGLWFGVRLNYILWGLYIAFFALLEELWLEKYLRKIPAFFTRTYTFVLAMLSFVIFGGDSVKQSLEYVRYMFGGGDLLYSGSIVYLIGSNYLLLILSLLFSTSLFSRVGGLLEKKFPLFSQLGTVVVNAALLLLLTGFMLVG